VWALALLGAAGCPSRRWRAPLGAPDAGLRASWGAVREPPRDAGVAFRVPTVRIPQGDEVPCSTDADCRPGQCFTAELEGRYSAMFRDCTDGTLWRERHRLGTCVRPECRGDGDCPPSARCADVQMLPFPQRVCMPAQCRGDGDCRAHGRGVCTHYLRGRRCEHGGWACAYPSDECYPPDPFRRCTAPRGMIAWCVPRQGRFRCVVEPPPPP
jgi:hypothetical protein